jgi:hypothetical protein
VWSVGAGWAGTFLLLLFPTGRLPTPRWRIVAWLAGGGIVLLAVGIAFTPGPFEAYPSYTNPLGISAAEGILAVLQSIGGIALLVSGFAAIASLIVRFLRSSSEEREQLKWLLYAAALVGLCLVSAIVIETVVGTSEEVNDLTNLLITTSLAAIPVTMGIAILRYRLYEIDLIINRTLVYGSLTAMLVLVYVCGVISLQYLLRLLTGQESNLAIVVSTLAIAALFNPLRRRIQSFVDHRFYRRKYDAAKTLEVFGARLRDETDLDEIADDLVEIVRETMQPAHVSLWLRPSQEATSGKKTLNQDATR